MHDGLHSVHIRCLWWWFGSGNCHWEFEREGRKRRPCNPKTKTINRISDLYARPRRSRSVNIGRSRAQEERGREHGQWSFLGAERKSAGNTHLSTQSLAPLSLSRSLSLTLSGPPPPATPSVDTHTHTQRVPRDDRGWRTGAGPRIVCAGHLVPCIVPWQGRLDSDELGRIGEPWQRKDELRRGWWRLRGDKFGIQGPAIKTPALPYARQGARCNATISQLAQLLSLMTGLR